MIAALFVQPKGHYPTMEGVDAWDKQRNAMLYRGPYSVVAHPPCARWSMLAAVVEATHGIKRGDDNGMFRFAVESVRRWGGVLEHPHASRAFRAYNIREPRKNQTGWTRNARGEWVTYVRQSNYGHRATKPTWLFYCGKNPPPDLDWRLSEGTAIVTTVGAGNSAGRKTGGDKVLGKDEAMDSPIEFANLLVDMARNCGGPPGR